MPKVIATIPEASVIKLLDEQFARRNYRGWKSRKNKYVTIKADGTKFEDVRIVDLRDHKLWMCVGNGGEMRLRFDEYVYLPNVRTLEITGGR